VALSIAINKLVRNRVLDKSPIINQVCAVSCGIFKGMSVTDLDYAEDSKCDTDINFVLSEGNIIEVQGTAEQAPFSFEELKEMYELAESAAQKIKQLQINAINS
jgi:ribonuclease PH